MPQGFFDEIKATAGLPNLDIEIVRSRSPAGDAERITIRLQATPSFGAFGRFLEVTNPFYILDALRSNGLDALARRLRGKASIQEFRSPADYGGVRRA